MKRKIAKNAKRKVIKKAIKRKNPKTKIWDKIKKVFKKKRLSDQTSVPVIDGTVVITGPNRKAAVFSKMEELLSKDPKKGIQIHFISRDGKEFLLNRQPSEQELEEMKKRQEIMAQRGMFDPRFMEEE